MNLNFQINNEEDILYLRNIDESKLEDLLRTTISIGLKSIQMSEVNMNCHSYIDPIKDIVHESTLDHKEKLYKDVYESDEWINNIAPKVEKLIDRNTIVVHNLSPTALSIMK